MSLTITNPSFDKIYPMYAWRDNNIRLVLTQGEGLTATDGTVAHVKTPKFQLRDDRGVIDLTSCEVSLALTRPDGSEDLLACSSASGEAVQGIVSCPITASATAIAGQAIGEIRVLSASSGNPTGIIKFFGVHFQIYKGVSDEAAEQSTRFSALIAALQEVAAVTPEPGSEDVYNVRLDTEIAHGGTNPVASGVLYDYLQGNYRQISFAHENNEGSYDDGGVYIDDATDIKKMYYVKNSNGARVGILFCVQTPGYNYASQVKIDASGNITTRVKTKESGEADYTWKSWTPVGTTRNIQDGAVTTPKLADGAVTSAKIGSGEVKTTNVEDGSITTAKLHSGVIDSTLSTQGAAAEAAVTGKRLKALEELNEPYNLYDRGTVYQIVDSNGNAASGLTIQSDGSLLCKVTYGAGNVRRLLDSARQLSPGTYTLSGKITLNENVTDTTATRSARCQIGSAVAAQTVPLTTERGGSESVPKTGNSGWFKFTATLSEAETFKFSVAPSSNLYCSYSLPAVISDLQLVKGSEIGDYSPNSHTNVDIKLRQEVEKGFENVEAEINAKAEKSRVDAHIEGLNLTINAAKSSDNQYYGSLYFEGDYYKGMPITVNHVRTDESNYTMQMFFYRAEPYDNDTKINIGSGNANQVAPNTSKTFVLPEKAVMMRIYYNAFPMTATITAPPVSHYLGDRIDDIAGDVADAVEAVGAFDVHVSGLNLSIDRAKADNNSTDGSIAFEGDFYKGMELNVSGYTQPEGVASTLQFYFKVHKTDSTVIKPPVWRISPNTDGVITVPENCEVMSIYCAHFPVTGVTITAPPLGKYLNDTVSELIGSSTDIVTLNKNALARLDEAKTFVKRRGRTDTYTPTFALLHFSDIHGATTALTRLVELKNHLGSKLSDTICTGDMVIDKYEDTMSFWDGVTGAGSILTCIGNHDVHHQGESSYTADQIGQTDTYTRYFAPYKDGWGVTIGENLTYYYKDYPTNKVRLIALNYLLTGDEATAQNTWLQARLAEAKTNGYTVIVAIHCQLQNSNAVDCSFTTFGKTTFGGQLDESYQASVQSFINDGGLFACYISGHTHWDAVAYNSNYPNQLCITVTIAGINMNDNDQPRLTGTITQDAANIVVLDTDIQTLKIIRVGANVDTYLRERNVLTYNYGSHSVVADY